MKRQFSALSFFLILFCFVSYAQVSLPVQGVGQAIHHTAYDLEFSDQHKDPRWVQYMTCRYRANTKIVDRTNDFRPDPSVTTGSATLADYVGSHLQRGHMAPADDFRWNAKTESESFFLSNMCPQNGSFNGGLWGRLEKQVRTWADKYDTLYVVSGPVLRDGLPKMKGTTLVSVPDSFYKVILEYRPPVLEAVGFLMKGQNAPGAALGNFAVSVDSVEHVTGIDFFPSIPDSVENHVDTAFWGLTMTTGTKSGHHTTRLKVKSAKNENN